MRVCERLVRGGVGPRKENEVTVQRMTRRHCSNGLLISPFVLVLGGMVASFSVAIGIVIAAIGLLGGLTCVILSPEAYCPNCAKRVYACSKTPGIFTILDHGLCPECGKPLEFNRKEMDEAQHEPRA